MAKLAISSSYSPTEFSLSIALYVRLEIDFLDRTYAINKDAMRGTFICMLLSDASFVWKFLVTSAWLHFIEMLSVGSCHMQVQWTINNLHNVYSLADIIQ